MKRRKEHRAAAIHAISTDCHELVSSSTPSISYTLSIGDIALMTLLASGTLLGYTMTLYPTIAGGDSGELVAESCHLGISHPPGYPLYNIVVHLFTHYLPFGDTPAWRANFFSAVCGTTAVTFIYLSLLHWMAPTKWNGRRVAAATAAALFGFSPLIWTYAVGAEVFALNNAFAAVLIYLLLQYARRLDFNLALIGAFLCGLAMCNQHTMVLFEVPIIGWVLWSRRQTLWWKEFAQLAGALMLGLTPYLYMPLVALWHPQPGSWGDVSTFSGFLHHVRRADYGTFRLYASNERNEDVWTRLYLYGVDVATREIPFQLAFPVVALGMLQTLKSDRFNHQLGWFVMAVYTFYMIIFHSLANLPLNEGLLYGVQMRFWQQPNVILFIWFGLGLGYIVDLVKRVGDRHFRALRTIIVVLLDLSCLALISAQICRWYKLCDQSQAFYIRNYAQALLDPLPLNAVLLVNFDLQWTSLRYVQRCEFRRPDVMILNLSMMTYTWFAGKHDQYAKLQFPGSRLVPYGSMGEGFSMTQFLDANIGPTASKASRKQPRIFLGGKLSYNDQDVNEKYTLVPYGLLDEFRSQLSPSPSLKSWYSSQVKVKTMIRDRLSTLPPKELYDDKTWEWTIARDHGMKELSWATYLLERTIAEDPENLTLLSEAAKPMERSYQLEPHAFWNAASTLKNLGLAYAQMVKSSQEFPAKDPFFNRVVGSSVEDSIRLKERASARMLEVWSAWLQVPEAMQDPGYEPIEGIVRKFVPEKQKTGQSRKKGKKKKKAKKRAFTKIKK